MDWLKEFDGLCRGLAECNLLAEEACLAALADSFRLERAALLYFEHSVALSRCCRRLAAVERVVNRNAVECSQVDCYNAFLGVNAELFLDVEDVLRVVILLFIINL